MAGKRKSDRSNTAVDREATRLCCDIIEILDRHGAEYFDLCDEKSEDLQGRIERAIHAGFRRLGDELRPKE